MMVLSFDDYISGRMPASRMTSPMTSPSLFNVAASCSGVSDAFETGLGELLLRIRQFEHVRDRVVQGRDDLARCAGRRHDGVTAADRLHFHAGFQHGRHVGGCRRALPAERGNQSQPPVLACGSAGMRSANIMSISPATTPVNAGPVPCTAHGRKPPRSRCGKALQRCASSSRCRNCRRSTRLSWISRA